MNILKNHENQDDYVYDNVHQAPTIQRHLRGQGHPRSPASIEERVELFLQGRTKGDEELEEELKEEKAEVPQRRTSRRLQWRGGLELE